MDPDGVLPDVLVGIDWTARFGGSTVVCRRDGDKIHVLPSSGTNPMNGAACAVQGHRAVIDDGVTYPDGLVACRCAACGERITIDRIPGGQHVLEARTLAVAALSPIATEQVMALVLAAERRLVEERTLLDEARQQLDLAKRSLAARLAKAK